MSFFSTKDSCEIYWRSGNLHVYIPQPVTGVVESYNRVTGVLAYLGKDESNPEIALIPNGDNRMLRSFLQGMESLEIDLIKNSILPISRWFKNGLGKDGTSSIQAHAMASSGNKIDAIFQSTDIEREFTSLITVCVKDDDFFLTKAKEILKEQGLLRPNTLLTLDTLFEEMERHATRINGRSLKKTLTKIAENNPVRPDQESHLSADSLDA